MIVQQTGGKSVSGDPCTPGMTVQVCMSLKQTFFEFNQEEGDIKQLRRDLAYKSSTTFLSLEVL